MNLDQIRLFAWSIFVIAGGIRLEFSCFVYNMYTKRLRHLWMVQRWSICINIYIYTQSNKCHAIAIDKSKHGKHAVGAFLFINIIMEVCCIDARFLCGYRCRRHNIYIILHINKRIIVTLSCESFDCVYVYVCVTITKKTTYIFFLHLFVIVTHTNQLLLSNSKFNDVWEHAKSQLNMYKLDV